MNEKSTANQDIRNRLDGLSRMRGHEVKTENHHFLTLSELNWWIKNHAVPFASGVMLDYGCGAKPYKELFEPKIDKYVGADVAVAAGVEVDVLIVPGEPLPFEDQSFDTVLSTQTLEHVPDPAFYLSQASRVLKEEGHLILTAPMMWRHHEEPFDYTRFTKFGIEHLLKQAGFELVEIKACGGMIAGVAQTILDAMACKGKIYPSINRLVNPLVQKLDTKFRDNDFAICWMALARRVGTAKHHVAYAPMTPVVLKCPVCDSTEVSPGFAWKDYQIRTCQVCDADFVTPSPTPAQLAAAYDNPSYFGGDLVGGYSDYDAQTTPVLEPFAQLLGEIENKIAGRRVLDVGCAFGSHLAMAAERGWKITGVEISAPAREEASKRLAGKGPVYSSIGHLPPQSFDLVILMDVIEHMPSPRQVFYDLFSKGAITPETWVVVSTPNVRSHSAVEKGAGWEYYHPPYHVTYFSGFAMRRMLEELRFSHIDVRGTYPDTRIDSGQEEKLVQSAGIQAIASGSDFAAFMQERYVPGTWSELTAYEHIPRYAFSLQFAKNQNALDFGCGTGYGSATLAEVANHVLAVDISDEALKWAKAKHRLKNIEFRKVSDLGVSLKSEAFGLITCFEVIEHLSASDQKSFVENVSRMLDPDGVFVISTPNSLMTMLYGDNPFHLKELSLPEFRSLLEGVFPFVRLFSQKIRPGVSISEDEDGEENVVDVSRLTNACGPDVCEPAAYVAVCGKRKIDGILKLTSWDSSNDFIFETIKGFPRPRA